MIQGRILKGIGGFYYVLAEGITYECRARGLFKLKKETPLVGDRVEIQIQSTEPPEGYILKLLKRDVELTRPAVANVEQAIIVFAAHSPEFNPMLLDKLLILCTCAGIDPVICINKSDLGLSEKLAAQLGVYERIGYPVIQTSTRIEGGTQALCDALQDRTSVFAGPSGVGKSSLLNKVQPNLRLQTGVISEKIKRGKHTTRHSELMPLEIGGWVVDTPGFTSLDLDAVEPEKLADCFPEFKPHIELCRFNDCSHLNEPGCAVQEQLGSEIALGRYESYRALYTQLIHDRRNKSW